MSIGRFIWHDLITTDVEAAKRFYGELLGWTTIDWSGPEDAPNPEPYPMIQAKGAERAQGGMMANQTPGIPPHWVANVITDDADALAARATAAGGGILFGPFDIPGVGRNVLVRDPQGAALAFIAFLGEGMAPPEGLQPAGSFVWDELMTNDTAGAAAFYGKVIGWGTQTWDNPEVDYTLFTAGETQAAGMMPLAEGMPPVPYWLPYVNVDSAEATAARVQELGGSVLAGPFEVPTIGWILIIGDPQGAALGMIQPDLSGMGA